MSDLSLKPLQCTIPLLTAQFTLGNAMSPINCNGGENIDSSSSCKSSSKMDLDSLSATLEKRPTDMPSIISAAKEDGVLDSLQGKVTYSRLPFIFVGGESHEQQQQQLEEPTDLNNSTQIQSTESTEIEVSPLLNASKIIGSHSQQRFLAPGVSFLKIQRVPQPSESKGDNLEEADMKKIFSDDGTSSADLSSSTMIAYSEDGGDILSSSALDGIQKPSFPFQAIDPPSAAGVHKGKLMQPSISYRSGGSRIRLKDVLLVDDYLLDSMNIRSAPSMSHRVMKSNAEVLRLADKIRQNDQNSQQHMKLGMAEPLEQTFVGDSKKRNDFFLLEQNLSGYDDMCIAGAESSLPKGQSTSDGGKTTNKLPLFHEYLMNSVNMCSADARLSLLHDFPTSDAGKIANSDPTVRSIDHPSHDQTEAMDDAVALPSVIDPIRRRSTLEAEVWISNGTKLTNSKIIFKDKLHVQEEMDQDEILEQHTVPTLELSNVESGTFTVSDTDTPEDEMAKSSLSSKEAVQEGPETSHDASSTQSAPSDPSTNDGPLEFIRREASTAALNDANEGFTMKMEELLRALDAPRCTKEMMSDKNRGQSCQSTAGLDGILTEPESDSVSEIISFDRQSSEKSSLSASKHSGKSTNPLSPSTLLLNKNTTAPSNKAIPSFSPTSSPEEHVRPFKLSDLKQILFFFVIMVQGQTLMMKYRSKKKRRTWMSRAKAFDEAEEIRIQAQMEAARRRRKEAREKAEREAALIKEREEELILAQQEADRQYIEEQAAQLQAREEELLKAEEIVARLMVKEAKQRMEKEDKLRRQARKEAARVRASRDEANIRAHHDAARLKAAEELCINAIAEAAAMKQAKANEELRRKVEVESAWKRLVESEPFSADAEGDSSSSGNESQVQDLDVSGESLFGVGIISSDEESNSFLAVHTNPNNKITTGGTDHCCEEGKTAVESDEETVNASNGFKRLSNISNVVGDNEDAKAEVLKQALIRLKSAQDERRKMEEEKNGQLRAERVQCFWTDEETRVCEAEGPNFESSEDNFIDIQRATIEPVGKERVLQMDGGEAVWWKPANGHNTDR